MQIDPLDPLQLAVVTALTAVTGMPAVYDHVPDTVRNPPTSGTIPPPYVAIGAAWTTPADSHSGVGFNAVIQLDVWSRYRGFREINDVTNLIYNTLHHVYVNVSGFGRVETWIDERRVMRDPNPDMRHGIVACHCFLAPNRTFPPI